MLKKFFEVAAILRFFQGILKNFPKYENMISNYLFPYIWSFCTFSKGFWWQNQRISIVLLLFLEITGNHGKSREIIFCREFPEPKNTGIPGDSQPRIPGKQP